MGFKISDDLEWQGRYNDIWWRITELVFAPGGLFDGKSLGLLNGKDPKNLSYINPKLITWNDEIKTRFNGWEDPYSKYVDATGVLKIASVYQQGSNYHLQVFLKEFKYRERDVEFKSQLSDEGHDTVY